MLRIILLTQVFYYALQTKETPIFVLEIGRHGARNGKRGADVDNLWKRELNPTGEREQYILGRETGERYMGRDKLLSEEFKKKEVRIGSTNSNRTLMSAVARTMGMYAPSKQRLTQRQSELALPPIALSFHPSKLSELHYISPDKDTSADSPSNISNISNISNMSYPLPHGWTVIPVHSKQSKVDEFKHTCPLAAYHLKQLFNSSPQPSLIIANHIQFLNKIADRFHFTQQMRTLNGMKSILINVECLARSGHLHILNLTEEDAERSINIQHELYPYTFIHNDEDRKDPLRRLGQAPLRFVLEVLDEGYRAYIQSTEPNSERYRFKYQLMLAHHHSIIPLLHLLHLTDYHTLPFSFTLIIELFVREGHSGIYCRIMINGKDRKWKGRLFTEYTEFVGGLREELLGEEELLCEDAQAVIQNIPKSKTDL